MTETRRDPLSYRSPDLLLAIIGYLADTDDGEVPLDQLIEHHTTPDGPAWRTVDGAIRDLQNYGALRIVRRPHGRSAGIVRLTTLGRHWIDQDPTPALPGHDPGESPLTEADLIARRLEHELLNHDTPPPDAFEAMRARREGLEP